MAPAKEKGARAMAGSKGTRAGADDNPQKSEIDAVGTPGAAKPAQVSGKWWRD